MNDKNFAQIDGHKPLDAMTNEELDEFFLKEFGLNFEDFKNKYPLPEKSKE